MNKNTFGSDIRDKHGTEIKNGDTLNIDFDGAAKIIGEGLLVDNIRHVKPTAEARLKVEFMHGRFWLVWRTHNGGANTGEDVAMLDAIKNFVEVAA